MKTTEQKLQVALIVVAVIALLEGAAMMTLWGKVSDLERQTDELQRSLESTDSDLSTLESNLEELQKTGSGTKGGDYNAFFGIDRR